jgi:phosphoenolpyruvate carboxylase
MGGGVGGVSAFGEELRSLLEATIRSILLVTTERRLLENDPVVRRAVEARLPFCDTLNILQGTCLVV